MKKFKQYVAESTIDSNGKRYGKKSLRAAKPQYTDPVHVDGVGVMERPHAQKFYPNFKHTETNQYKK
jgi:hypothetical protein